MQLNLNLNDDDDESAESPYLFIDKVAKNPKLAMQQIKVIGNLQSQSDTGHYTGDLFPIYVPPVLFPIEGAWVLSEFLIMLISGELRHLSSEDVLEEEHIITLNESIMIPASKKSIQTILTFMKIHSEGIVIVPSPPLINKKIEDFINPKVNKLLLDLTHADVVDLMNAADFMIIPSLKLILGAKIAQILHKVNPSKVKQVLNIDNLSIDELAIMVDDYDYKANH